MVFGSRVGEPLNYTGYRVKGFIRPLGRKVYSFDGFRV